MIDIRRADTRQHERHRRRDVWRTFGSGAFGNLEALDEQRLPPAAVIPQHLRDDAEIVTYVREGSLAYDDDASGRTGVVAAGEFQRAGCGLRLSASDTWAHAFQICLRVTETGFDPHHEQKRFSAAERRGGLRCVASPDARRGSLKLHEDALLYSAILDPGQHLVYELALARMVWLHVVSGRVTLLDLELATGDGAGVTGERVVSLIAREDTEILLLDTLAARGP